MMRNAGATEQIGAIRAGSRDSESSLNLKRVAASFGTRHRQGGQTAECIFSFYQLPLNP
jgi:hypothetical protein